MSSHQTLVKNKFIVKTSDSIFFFSFSQQVIFLVYPIANFFFLMSCRSSKFYSG